MEKIVEHGLLYDFYGELLTEHQRRIYEDAVYRDMSVTEIADLQGISRQGVHDLLKRCDRILTQYEERLGLVKKFGRIREKVRRIDALAERAAVRENGVPGVCGEPDAQREETSGACRESDVQKEETPGVCGEPAAQKSGASGVCGELGGQRDKAPTAAEAFVQIRRLSDEILEEL